MQKSKVKILGTLIACASLCCTYIPVQAEEETEDYSNTSYWNTLCTGSSLTSEQQKSCNAYLDYMKTQNAGLQAQIDSIDAKKKDISDNIQTYASNIQAYNAQIDSINGMIADLNSQIAQAQDEVAAKQAEIDASQIKINEKTEEVNQLKEKVGQRIARQQETMRTNSIIDVLMGAESFDDFIRLANGFSDITSHDNDSLNELNNSIAELNEMKKQLTQEQSDLIAVQTDLQSGMSALTNQQTVLLASKYQLDVIQSTYESQLAQATGEEKEALEAIASNQNTISSVNNSIADSIAAQASASAAAAATATPSSTGTSDNPAPSTAPSANTPAAGDSSKNPYYGGWGNCTWSAWQLVHDTLHIDLAWFPGNAGDWLAGAQAAGYSTGSTPRVYSIAVYPYHVAFVTQVNGDMVYIKEGNYLGRYNERWVSSSYNSCLGYIYL